MSRYVLIDATGLVVNVMMWDGNDDWHSDEYTAIQSDTADIGWTYSNGEFLVPQQRTISLTNDQLAADARTKRDMLIAATDYLLMSDYQITTEKLETVKVYRQSLRDVTQQTNFPTEIVWPAMPS